MQQNPKENSANTKATIQSRLHHHPASKPISAAATLSFHLFVFQVTAFQKLPCQIMYVFLASKVTGGWIKLHNEALHNLYY
jgi:hypothetical protein